ncbi:MAG: hypothetical protein HRU70_06345 [Phycisphaeraceae bacterium]|nr:MAG: hypothetical protein HRU70_06345 [Phycisphaeraceae bacterium]
MKSIANRLVVPLVLVGIAGSALGQPSASESFEYSLGTPLFGQNGGLGFSTPWQSAGYGSWGMSSMNEVVIRNGLMMTSAGGRTESGVGGGQRTLTTPIAGTPGTSAWVSFVARRMTGSTSTSWLGVKLPSTGGSPFLFLGQPFGRAHWGADHGGAGGIVESAEAASVAHIVARIDFRAGPDDVRVWINPEIDNAPADADAALTLLSYGDFQNITKVLIETGTTAGAQTGAIDEVRVADSFGEAVPMEDGSVYRGKPKKKKANTSICVSCFSWGLTQQAFRRQNPGIDTFGVDSEIDSAGVSMAISPGEFPPGSVMRHKYKGWDGTIKGSTGVRRQADGNIAMELDFPGAAAVRVVVREPDGTIITDEVTPGEFRYWVNGGAVNPWGPCPDGSFPEWRHTLVFYDPPKLVNWQYIYFEFVWTYGCGGSTSTNRTITVSPIFDAAGLGVAGIGTMELEASGPMSEFTIRDCADVPHTIAPESTMPDLTVSGLGNVLVQSRCDDGTQCTDNTRRKIRATGIGSEGQDGVEIRLPAPALRTKGQFTLGELSRGTGEAVARRRGTDASGVESDLESVSIHGDNGRSIVTPDFSALGSTHFTVTGFDATGHVVVDEVFPNGTPIILEHVICPPNQVLVWGWWTYWHWNPWPTSGYWNTIWTVVGCSSLGTGGGGNTSTERVVISPVEPVVTGETTGVSLTARGTSEIEVFGLGVEDSTAPCLADYNDDGFVDFFDLDAYIECFEGLSCPDGRSADFNGDGFVDFFDLDDYIVSFETGC